jgi:endonuclease III-like uncharacterized protein
MKYKRVKFVCYAAFTSFLLYILKVDPFIVDLYGGIAGEDNDKSGSGKTSTAMTAIGGVGNIAGDNRLLYRCESTRPFVDNISAKVCDFPFGLDESTKLLKDVKIKFLMIIQVTLQKVKRVMV